MGFIDWLVKRSFIVIFITFIAVAIAIFAELKLNGRMLNLFLIAFFVYLLLAFFILRSHKKRA